jgi:hypothetical protein
MTEQEKKEYDFVIKTAIKIGVMILCIFGVIVLISYIYGEYKL